ncbi:M24 family metallopeptidase, partial [Candidatus Woesearchaeota archaeon]|nr:M24 family metallopeptidase [Candidatus Woesearchaeota archaeon]
EEAVRMTKKGMKAQKILKIVNSNLGKYKKYFTHGLGHQIGLDVHEGRGIRKKEKDFKLEKGMIITIEPGIYRKGKFGIRIEDMVLVGKDAEVMTKTTKRLIMI